MSPRQNPERTPRTAPPWRSKLVVTALAAALLAGPGVAQAVPKTAPAPREQMAAATITWTLERASNPTQDQQTATTSSRRP